MEEKKQDLIIVARPAEGFRRCGIHHPAQQVRHPAGTFGMEDYWTLKREPQLVVIEVDPLPEQEAGSVSEDGAAPAKTGRGKGGASG
ncbi:HI1506-related protein [Azospirillum agricola]|uniref:HI1506-related protein n=1 Tax=Azospirillum agricola TaxID=1720247 RepID=UPI000A0EF7DD|nr:HI1506-related protein [Azospirillum agricola]SMH62536.1 hypothetical protein SAMN02982994_6339 [Azospirillum lipoferum]